MFLLFGLSLNVICIVFFLGYGKSLRFWNVLGLMVKMDFMFVGRLFFNVLLLKLIESCWCCLLLFWFEWVCVMVVSGGCFGVF